MKGRMECSLHAQLKLRLQESLNVWGPRVGKAAVPEIWHAEQHDRGQITALSAVSSARVDCFKGGTGFLPWLRISAHCTLVACRFGLSDDQSSWVWGWHNAEWFSAVLLTSAGAAGVAACPNAVGVILMVCPGPRSICF
jgi:hypothetical protein